MRNWSATAVTSRKSGPRASSSVTISSTPDLFAGEHAVEHLADGRAGACGPARRGQWCREQDRRGDVAASGPRVVAGQAFEVGGATHREAHVVVQPAVAVAHVLGVHGEPRRQRVAGRLGRLAQAVERGPRALGVHVIGGDRRDAAPVVDPGRDQRGQVVGVGEVGRRLQVDRRVEHEPGDGDGPEELVGRAGGCLPHRRAGLGQEVLDDHLLHVTVALVRGLDGEQGVEAFLTGLADADEDAGGEGHPGPARGFEGGEPAGGRLVGRTRVGPARLAEALGEGLDHHPLRR